MKQYTLVFAVALGVSVGACSQQKPATEPVATNAARSVSVPGAHPGDTVVIGSDVQKKCGLPSPGEGPKFGFDSAAVASNGRPVLTALAHCMKDGALRGKRVSLVGRADPRGEAEFNMSLGSSRAESVAAFLRSLGVAKGQLGVTSRGEIDAAGHDESTWEQDRRVDVTLPPHT